MVSNARLLGTHSHVVVIDPTTGADPWHANLKSGFSSDGSFSLLAQADRLCAHTSGELFCLDVHTGEILWTNGRWDLGYGIASLAVEGQPEFPVSRGRGPPTGAPGSTHRCHHLSRVAGSSVP